MAWVQGALAAVSVGSSILGGLSAKKEAEEAAEEQAALTFSQRKREIEMRQREAAREYSAGRAAVGASNLQFSGSPQRYLNALNMENMREVAWATQAARQERKAIRAGASGVGDSFFYQAAGDALGYAAQAYANRARPQVTAPTTPIAPHSRGQQIRTPPPSLNPADLARD